MVHVPNSIVGCPVQFLTGAGASVPLGRYTTVQFWEHFRSILLRELQGRSNSTFAELAQQLLVLGAAAGVDIERVLSIVQRNQSDASRLSNDAAFKSRVLSNSPGPITDFELSNERIVGLIEDEVISHYSTIDADTAGDLYKPLFADFESWFETIPNIGHTIPFFTLNYDRAVEAAASRLDVRCVDGLGDQRGATDRRWSRRQFEQYKDDDKGPAVILVKLHGSVRWGWHREVGGEIVELSAGVGRNPGMFKHVVLYPTELPKPLYVEPFRTGYRMLREALGHARVLFVIGCSLRDVEIRTSLSDAMDDNAQLHVVVVGPEADHSRVASQLDLDETRVAAVRKAFQTAPESDIGNEFMACLRGFAQVAAGVASQNSADRIFKFGRTFDDWPWPSRQQLEAILSSTPSSRLRHRFGQRTT